MNVFERERSALAAHRKTMQGSSLPPPKRAPKGTFLHGFFLPFSLIVATIRDPFLRGTYVRLAVMRGLLVVLVGVLAIANGNISRNDSRSRGPRIGVVASRHHHPKRVPNDDADAMPDPKSTPVHVNLPGLHVDFDEANDQAEVSVLGQQVPVSRGDDDEPDAKLAAAPDASPPAPPSFARRAWTAAGRSWAWLLTLFAFLSATEGVVVFFSRRWDDWLSFHASRLAKIIPEDAAPTEPKIAFDLKWLYRKVKRRFRGYVVFAAGLPALLPLRFLPTIGPWAFTIAATLWGWYWLGVFSAAKSAHAWADEATALSPRPIRALNDHVARGWVLAPLRLYGRSWARLTRGVNPAVATFERTPAAFLGLALARAFLSLPGVYLLARPIVPVAAGRLCAEADPADRFSAPALK